MPRVVFMRHAKTDRNQIGQFAGRADCNTTPEGLEKAKDSFNYTGKDFDFYYCSPLKRTRQTLDAVVPNQEPIVDERIIERDLGDWEDEYYDNIPNALIQSYVKGYFDPPNSEKYTNVTKRVKSFLKELYERYKPEDRILVVTHAGVLRQIRDNLLPNMDKGIIGNGALLIVSHEDFEAFMERLKQEEQNNSENKR